MDSTRPDVYENVPKKLAPKFNEPFDAVNFVDVPKTVRQSRTFRVAVKRAEKKAKKLLGGRSLYPHELRQIESEVAKYV